MLRADNVICGTSTTGTGTLTLAATPTPPGGVDFDVFARATGIGFGNSAAILVSYTIIEYTSSAFSTAKATEKGIGTLTLGGSSGITNATLARTTLQSTATSLNSQPASQNIVPGTGISIGTAANTLVFIGASSADTIAFEPYVDSTSTNATGYVGPLQYCLPTAAAALNNFFAATLQDTYAPFYWTTPMLVKRISIGVAVGTSGGTSNAYARIYAVGTDGRPGKLLYDFGLLGSSNSSLASSNSIITSGAAGNGYYLVPGVYFLDLIASYAGGGTTPQAYGTSSALVPTVLSVDQPANNAFGLPVLTRLTATGGTAGTAPDPANLTGAIGLVGGDVRTIAFGLKAS